MGHDVPEDDSEDDHDSTHRGHALLVEMSLEFGLYELTDVVAPKGPNRNRREENYKDESDGR
jgi:hypothetical protein